MLSLCLLCYPHAHVFDLHIHLIKLLVHVCVSGLVQIATLASVYHKPADTFVSRQRIAVQKADELQVSSNRRWWWWWWGWWWGWWWWW